MPISRVQRAHRWHTDRLDRVRPRPEAIRPFAPGSILPLMLPTTAMSRNTMPATTNSVAIGAENIPVINSLMIAPRRALRLSSAERQKSRCILPGPEKGSLPDVAEATATARRIVRSGRTLTHDEVRLAPLY